LQLLSLPQSHEAVLPLIITYVVVEKEMKNKGKLYQNHDASIGAAAVGEKACLGTKQH